MGDGGGRGDAGGGGMIGFQTSNFILKYIAGRIQPLPLIHGKVSCR